MPGLLLLRALRDRLSVFAATIRKNLISLILLNVLFWGFCMTIVAVGPSVTALFAILRKFVTGKKPESVLGEFWDSFTRDIAKSFIVSLVYAVAAFLTQHAAQYYFSAANAGQAWLYPVGVIIMILLLFLVITGFYLFLLLGMGRAAKRDIIDSFMLSTGHPAQNLTVLALVAGVVFLTSLNPFFALGWYLLIGFSFTGLLIVAICNPNISGSERDESGGTSHTDKTDAAT